LSETSSTPSGLELHLATQYSNPSNRIYRKTANMSMFGGFGRPQPSSAEKIAAAEAEMDLVTDMFNK
jgi:hypothetical protein